MRGYITTDRASVEGNEIGCVRPSVCPSVRLSVYKTRIGQGVSENQRVLPTFFSQVSNISQLTDFRRIVYKQHHRFYRNQSGRPITDVHACRDESDDPLSFQPTIRQASIFRTCVYDRGLRQLVHSCNGQWLQLQLGLARMLERSVRTRPSVEDRSFSTATPSSLRPDSSRHDTLFHGRRALGRRRGPA